MAASGSFENAFRKGYKLRVEWVVNSQSIENNTSNMTVTAYLVSTGSTYHIDSTAQKTITLTINGTAYTKTAAGLANLSGNQKKALFAETVTISHNDDGTNTTSISCAFGLNITFSGVYFGTIHAPASGSATATLDTIPRPTTPTLATTTLTMGTAYTVSLPRKNSAFVHTLKILFGSTTRTIASNLGTSYSWTPPTNILAPDIPNAASGGGTLICETYNNGTLIGTKSVGVTLNVPSSVIPTFGATPITATETVSGVATKFGAFVQNISKVGVVVSASGVYGSTISAYRVTLDGLTYNASSFTSEKLLSNGTLTITAAITDSRGRTNTATQNITVLAYTPPVIHSFNVIRCNSDGTENPEGNRVKATFAFDITPVNNLNDKYYEVVYRETGTSAWGAVTSGNLYTFDGNVVSGAYFNVDKTYEVAINLYDYLSSNSAQLEVSTAFTLIDLRSTGKGIAFGKVSQSDTMEIALDLDLTGDFLQETTQTPTLLNSWVNYGAGYAPAGYWKDKLGIVHIHGMIKSGATAAETVIFTLPMGYRPATSEKFFTVSVNNICVIDVYSSGNVAIKAGANSGWVSLSGIAFRAN